MTRTPSPTPDPLPDTALVARIRAGLLTWYAAHRRDLPWRGAGDAYAVWVSEAMLQQTQVQTVIPYFERWMRRFPTVTALAVAPLEEALRYWAGLGYYARARNLHAAARVVAEQYGGQLPADARALQALPGVGRYTAGAILSIAFGLPAPILDANAIRVLSRLFLVEGDPSRGATQRHLWALAEALVPEVHPGEFNQAVMELGATVCTPEAPLCATCPVATACGAHAEGRVADLPQRPRKPAVVQETHVSAVVEVNGAVLLAQRPREARWGGLWEFPRVVCDAEETVTEGARRAAREVVGLQVEAGESLTVVRHTVTHHRIALHAVRCALLSGTPAALGCAAWVWVPVAEIGGLPLPAPQARIARALGAGAE